MKSDRAANKRVRRWSIPRSALFLVILVGAFVATGAHVGWLGIRGATAHADVSPTPVNQVPDSLPPGGVQLHDGDIVLTPWALAASSAKSKAQITNAMSSDQAIAAARVFATKPFPATALRAELTLPGSIAPTASAAASFHTVDHVPVWLVTFTSPTPVNVGLGDVPINVTHYTIAVDPVSGKYILGFYTP